jgi:2-C-methyl-D-erythritol 4-phosphate cytidylyltransferase
MPGKTRAAIIPAAGEGTRLGLGPKAILKIGETVLIDFLINTLTPLVDEVVIALPETLVNKFSPATNAKLRIIVGGRTRQETIELLIAATTADVKLIQDAARPFASRELCGKVLDAAMLHGAAGAFLDPQVPVGNVVEQHVGHYWDRAASGIFQAPQAFKRSVLTQAHCSQTAAECQSTAQLVIRAGYPLFVVPGEQENIKITTPFDWKVAQYVIAPLLGISSL